jgi:hypothetical protein
MLTYDEKVCGRLPKLYNFYTLESSKWEWYANNKNSAHYRMDLAEELLQTITLPVYKMLRQDISR